MEDKKKRQARQRRYDQKRRGKTVTIRFDDKTDPALAKSLRALISEIEKNRDLELETQTEALANWADLTGPLGGLLLAIYDLDIVHPTSPLPTIQLMIDDWRDRIRKLARIQQTFKKSVVMESWDKWIDTELARIKTIPNGVEQAAS
jgi:hypothetical protein